MKTISIQEMRETLAKNDAENLDTYSLREIFLSGCKGYNDYEELDIIDWYLNVEGYPHCLELDDIDPVKIIDVIVGNKVKYEVWQHEHSLDIKEV